MRIPVDFDAFNTTVSALYAAALDPNGCGAALRRIEDLTGSAGAVLGIIPRDRPLPGAVLSSRISAERCDAYARGQMQHCPRTAYGLAHPDAPYLVDAMILSEAEIDRDPVYDFFAREGLRYHVAKQLGSTANHHLNIGLQRTRAAGHAQSQDIALFLALKPHIDQAAQLAVRLGTLEVDGGFALATLEALPWGVVALDTSGNVRFANTAARQVLATDDGLRTEGRLIRLSRDAEQRRFEHRLAAALGIAEDPRRSAGWARASRPSGRRTYGLFVFPVAREAASVLPTGAAALLMIYETNAAPAADPAMPRALFGLTPAEQRLAAHLVSGCELHVAAQHLGISANTARAQLRSIFRKTAVSRRADLVAMLRGFVNAVAG